MRPWVARTALLALAFAGAARDSRAGGDAYRVKDLRTERTDSAYFAGDLGQLAGAALLLGGLPNTGAEPWVTDGTPAGTILLRNLAPGGRSSVQRLLGRAGDLVYFAAWTPATGIELWRSDGTAEGTLEVGDLAPGYANSWPAALGVLGDVLLFSADDADLGSQVWRTDGTPAGTRRVSELPGGVCGWAGHRDAARSTFSGRVYFAGDDGTHGCELFATDGTPGGERMVADIATGPLSSYPEEPWAAGGKLYVSATDFLHGRELWVTDGTARGTRLVNDLVPGEEDGDPWLLGEVAGGLAFAAITASFGEYRHLLWTDSQSGVLKLTEAKFWSGALVARGRLVFTGWDDLRGREPWVTDGTPEGTHLLADLRPGPESSIWGGSMASGSDGAYFIAWDAFSNGALYRTDGSPAGTVRIGATERAESIVGFAEVGGRQVFQFYWWEYCQPHSECDYWESWVSDGTSAGTHPLWPEAVESSSSRPRALTPRCDDLVFAANTDWTDPLESGTIALRTDGTEAGTVPMTTPGGELVAMFEAAGPLGDGELLFDGLEEDWEERLWRTDGDLVSIVRDPAAGGPENAAELTLAGGLVFFAGYDPAAGTEPWRSDGTAAGTFRLADVTGDDGGSYPKRFVEAAGRVWFAAESYELGCEPWESDGTPEGTLVHDLTPGPEGTLFSPWSSEIVPLAPDRDRLVLRGRNELKAWQPGEPGATPLKTLSEILVALSDEPLLTPFAGRVFFVDAGPDGGCELWATDGTAGGTLRVATVGWGWDEDTYWHPCPPRPTAFAGRLFFTACDAEAGCELWTSDGTEAGTHRFADLEPGPASLLPTQLVPIGDRLYFSGCQEPTGCEPWVSDGTVEGTRRLDDVAPGPLSSDPGGFTLADGLVYFAADDGTGSELWVWPLRIFRDGFETGDDSRWDPPTP